MIYRRLYDTAKENINDIAEQTLESFYINKDTKIWETLDGECFDNRDDALEHQYRYLLQEIPIEELEESDIRSCKMNVVNINGSSYPVCTNCDYRFDTKYARNSYVEMCKIAKGKFQYCPVCGAKYTGCQVEGVDLEKCTPNTKDWINRGLR